jgi:hypothetical protein
LGGPERVPSHSQAAIGCWCDLPLVIHQYPSGRAETMAPVDAGRDVLLSCALYPPPHAPPKPTKPRPKNTTARPWCV